ncbi:MAG: hypothetical protein Ct9H90mP6_00680 [Gammaproteobacteria bacterium]|nr:MAG: hypothetical protein Ct9H90mP6_00680 [Gammaproteobacteria bacterium]
MQTIFFYIKIIRVIGYSRVFPPGIKYDGASIGRIVTDLDYRGEKGFRKEGLHMNLSNF